MFVNHLEHIPPIKQPLGHPPPHQTTDDMSLIVVHVPPLIVEVRNSSYFEVIYGHFMFPHVIPVHHVLFIYLGNLISFVVFLPFQTLLTSCDVWMDIRTHIYLVVILIVYHHNQHHIVY